MADDDGVEEIRWWLDLLAEADRLHRQLPAAMMNEIDRSAGPHEVMRIAVWWASVSCESRQRVQAVLERALRTMRAETSATTHDAPDLRSAASHAGAALYELTALRELQPQVAQ